MEIFESVLYQIEDKIDANRLYDDINKYMESKGSKRLNRGHPLQHILNSTSGMYVSPSAMSSFELCPANYLVGKLFKEKTGVATSIGRTFHNIVERFYESQERTREILDKITEETIKEDEQFEKADDVRYYINNYWESDDYLGGPMDHQSLETATEVFIKSVINPLGVSLNVPAYLLIDRVDIRDDGIYLVDYKTGMGDPNPYMLGQYGYLPQMIFYKWGAEAEFGEEVKAVYLSTPGANTKKLRWVNMNVSSLVEQSKVIEKVYSHLERMRATRESKIFDMTRMRYCNSCHIKDICSVRLKSMNLDLDNLRTEIPIRIEIEDKYEEEDNKDSNSSDDKNDRKDNTNH